MVQVSCGFRNTFREQIARFCRENEIYITYRQSMGRYDSYVFDGIDTTVSDEENSFTKLEKFVDSLEKERKAKGALYKMIH